MARWYRLCIDIDRLAQPIGSSWEVHQDDERVSYGTTLVGPFDTTSDALEHVTADVIERFGLQLPLPF
mgnify:CR=1 FL=1